MSQANVDRIQSHEERFVAGDFLKLAEAFGSVWDIQAPLDLEILPAGDEKVLVLVGIDAIAKPTGKPICLKIAEIYTIRDGKIDDIVVHYWDTHEMVERPAAPTS